VVAEPILSATGLSSGYAQKLIVSGVSLDVRKGQIVSLIGPNGAGKSTLLKTIMGFVPVLAGSVRFFGSEVTTASVEARIRSGVAYVAQAGGAFPSLSVMDNLVAGAYLERDREVVRKRMATVLDRFPQLKPLLRAQAAVLSGGERRMLEIGRFLMQAPRLVLLDEPSIGLSPKLAGFLYDQVRHLRSEGISFLIVEQNVRKALEMSDHIYVLELGRNRFDGSSDVLQKDADLASLFLGAAARPGGA